MVKIIGLFCLLLYLFSCRQEKWQNERSISCNQFIFFQSTKVTPGPILVGGKSKTAYLRLKEAGPLSFFRPYKHTYPVYVSPWPIPIPQDKQPKIAILSKKRTQVLSVFIDDVTSNEFDTISRCLKGTVEESVLGPLVLYYGDITTRFNCNEGYLLFSPGPIIVTLANQPTQVGEPLNRAEWTAKRFSTTNQNIAIKEEGTVFYSRPFYFIGSDAKRFPQFEAGRIVGKDRKYYLDSPGVNPHHKLIEQARAKFSTGFIRSCRNSEGKNLFDYYPPLNKWPM